MTKLCKRYKIYIARSHYYLFGIEFNYKNYKYDETAYVRIEGTGERESGIYSNVFYYIKYTLNRISHQIKELRELLNNV